MEADEYLVAARESTALLVERIRNENDSELHANALWKMLVDEEVEAREIKVQAKQVAYKHVTRWGNLPALDRALLGGAVVCMTAACHLAGNFGSRCFATFTVTCTVALPASTT